MKSDESNASGELTAEATPGGRPPSAGPASAGISGSVVAQFEVLERIGAGGFGEVYRARDTRLGRTVAIKILPEALSKDAERRERFRREAVAASALNHPNICTVHDLVESNGRYLIVMELVEGKTLYAALKEGPLPLARLLPIALQVTEALGEAHRAGILHRDVKTGNIALTSRGQVKVLDFGLAKLLGGGSEGTDGPTVDRLTEDGSVFGTLAYMSPEQLLGKPLDGRSDLFSLGVVLYEMATGRLPFMGTSKVATADAILHAEPPDFGDRPVPDKLKGIVRKLLQKDPAKRYASAGALHEALKEVADSLDPAKGKRLSKGAWIGIAAAVVVVVAVAGWYGHRLSRERWAVGTVPEITRLVEAHDNLSAVALLRQARAVLPKEPGLEKLWLKATGELSIETDLPGAEVSIRPFKGNEDSWESVGETPLKKVRIAGAPFVFRIVRPGSATVTFLSGPGTLTFKLTPEGDLPAGMVPTGDDEALLGYPLNEAPNVTLDNYLIDRYEVTNEEYQKFVDAGGYREQKYWKQPFVREGRTLPWDEAVALFRDSTGRPGPATWEVGAFPKGKEKHPVAGVSWFEAAAYAEFTGKSLPTAYHWFLAAQTDAASLIVPGSNFNGAGTQPVGMPGTMSGSGTNDMAGNVKEWCWNESREGTRVILGGGFGGPEYMFFQSDAQSPWERRPNFGLRCVKLSSPPPPAAVAKLDPPYRDYAKEKPVSDEVFRVYKGLYAYDRTPLNAKVEETKETSDWTWEKVSLDAAYGNERVILHLFLPKNVAPPYQVVVYFPGSGAQRMAKFDPSSIANWGVDFLPRGGRALVFPVYKGTFERQDGYKASGSPVGRRDHTILWSKDLARSLDYLETRKEIDSTRRAFHGFSWGAWVAPNLLAVDGRFKAAILVSGGLMLRTSLPESDPLNFLPRMTTPALVLNDRSDSFFPEEASQVPFFRLLGTPEKDKKRLVYESGHGGLPRQEVIRETLEWLDRYLGPVSRLPGQGAKGEAARP